MRCSWCLNKVVYDSEAEAREEADKLRSLPRYQRRRGYLHAYPCPVSPGKFHIGHAPSRKAVAS